VREEAERLELDGFLVKPVTKSMIVDTLVNVFAEQGGATNAASSSEPARRLGGARILLAEDNEINQQIAVELLEGAGAAVRIACNGREAVDLLAHGPQPPPFDLVLMDLQMPEMDGYQATASLRANPRFETLPIIAMTAHATIEERQRCLSSGMNDHISKPIDPRVLFETVARYYQGAEGMPPERPGAAPNAPASPSAPPIAERGAQQPAPAEIPPPGDDLPAIEGLDAQDGLARVAGNRKLYRKLLRQFAEQQAAVRDQIVAALGRGEGSVAERLAHTLKGVAGNIGAKTVQAAAGSVEKLVREKASAEVLAPALEYLAISLDPLVRQLGDALGSPGGVAPGPAPAAGPAPDPAKAREVALRLADLLAQFDPTVLDFVEANRAALDPLFSREGWTAFEQHVQAYAFAEAQAQLDQALRSVPQA